MKFTIIAPHPDDEIIGCFSLIKKNEIGKILYLNSEKERMSLARKFCKDFGIPCKFISENSLMSYKFSDKEIYLIPYIVDRHPLHRLVNIIVSLKARNKGYYTTDMNSEFIHELKDSSQEKRQMLDKYYPDQKSLWDSDWKYFLFEGIVYDLL